MTRTTYSRTCYLCHGHFLSVCARGHQEIPRESSLLSAYTTRCSTSRWLLRNSTLHVWFPCYTRINYYFSSFYRCSDGVSPASHVIRRPHFLATFPFSRPKGKDLLSNAYQGRYISLECSVGPSECTAPDTHNDRPNSTVPYAPR
jgi:hypothetical protein